MTEQQIAAMRQLIEDLISAIEYHVEQTRPIHMTTIAIQAGKDALKTFEQQPADEPYGYFRYDMRLDAWVQSRDSNQGTPFYTRPQPAAKVSPLEFVTMVLEKEHLVGKPIFWAEWPNAEGKA